MKRPVPNITPDRGALAAALALLTFVPASAIASVASTAPGPGLFGLMALGVVGAIAVSRSRR